jgi:hypothetical protein
MGERVFACMYMCVTVFVCCLANKYGCHVHILDFDLHIITQFLPRKTHHLRVRATTYCSQQFIDFFWNLGESEHNKKWMSVCMYVCYGHIRKKGKGIQGKGHMKLLYVMNMIFAWPDFEKWWFSNAPAVGFRLSLFNPRLNITWKCFVVLMVKIVRIPGR